MPLILRRRGAKRPSPYRFAWLCRVGIHRWKFTSISPFGYPCWYCPACDQYRDPKKYTLWWNPRGGE